MRLYNVREAPFATGHFTKNFLSSLVILAVLGIATISCSESLPPYQDPAEVFQGKVTGQYVLTVADNSLKIYITLKNVFDETFQAQALLRGNLEIVLARKPEIRKTVSLYPSNILQARSYNSSNGMLTVDAGDSIRLGYSWDFIADDGTDLRRGIFILTEDPTCKSREIAKDETFILSGDIKVFERTAPVKFGPTAYTFCYVTNWVNTKFCPPAQTDFPCGRRPATQKESKQ